MLLFYPLEEAISLQSFPGREVLFFGTQVDELFGVKIMIVKLFPLLK